MSEDLLPDPSTVFGEAVRRRLRDEQVAWLVTVGADGTPQPNPVWFLWDGRDVLVYNRPDAKRVAHVRRRPNVALHLNGDDGGGSIVVVTGRAELVDDVPPPDRHPDYVAKYGGPMERVSGTQQRFAREYPVAMRIHTAKVRGF